MAVLLILTLVVIACAVIVLVEWHKFSGFLTQAKPAEQRSILERVLLASGCYISPTWRSADKLKGQYKTSMPVYMYMYMWYYVGPQAVFIFVCKLE